MKDTIEKIMAHKACIGCGLCEAVAKEDGCRMKIAQDGFYYPCGNVSRPNQTIVDSICPGKNVRMDAYGGLWGKVIETYDGWAVDSEARHKGSSGGVISAICIELLNSKAVTAVLHVGNDPLSPMYNKLCVSHTREDILQRSSSRYAPADVFSNIEAYLKADEVYAFVGKPCDIMALKAYLGAYPQYQSKVKVFLSFFCAGIPSYKGTEELLDSTKKLISLKYRGCGWPGNFTAKYEDGTNFEMSYQDSWGGVLGKYVNYRCKICPDGIGLGADIVAADSWKTKDGYPDFEEQDGRNFVLVRSKLGSEILRKCIEANAIQVEFMNPETISTKQPYQYGRRRQLSWRILGLQLASSGFFRFKGIGVFRNMRYVNPIKGIRICLGSIKRYIAK